MDFITVTLAQFDGIDSGAHIDLNDVINFLPALFHERLVNRNPSGRHNAVDTAQGCDSILEGTAQLLLVADVRLKVLRLDAETFLQAMNIFERFVPDIYYCYVAAHFAYVSGYGEAD